MPIHKVLFDGDTVELRTSSDVSGVNSISVTSVRNGLPPPRRVDGDEVAGIIQESLQGIMDFRQSINSLPVDDPDRDTDPARPDLFWDGSQLVGRAVKVSFTWTGTEYEILVTRV